MQEFGLTYKWDNVWVVFSPFTNFKILKFLHLGFKHCFVILENCGNFFIVDPLAFKIEVYSFYLGKDNLFPYLQKMGMTVVKTNIKGDFKTNWHFSIFTYGISALIGKLIGGKSSSVEYLKLPKGLSFMRDNILAIALTMSIIYIIVAIAAGSEYIEKELSNGQNFLVFSLIQGVTFAAGVSVVLQGVRMILGEIIPAFKGISEKLVPNAIPSLDCPIVFPYAPNAVLIGFIMSFIGGLVGLAILGITGGILIIPGVVPHFFCGATAGVFGNATGGKRGCFIGAFVNGILLTFLPLILLPILGDLGFQNTTFSDADFIAVGGIIGFICNLIK